METNASPFVNGMTYSAGDRKASARRKGRLGCVSATLRHYLFAGGELCMPLVFYLAA